MDFTTKLIELTKGRNKADLSREAGLAPTAISDYISKGYIPRADTALRLARALGVSLDWLVDDSADMTVADNPHAITIALDRRALLSYIVTTVQQPNTPAKLALIAKLGLCVDDIPALLHAISACNIHDLRTLFGDERAKAISDMVAFERLPQTIKALTTDEGKQ